MAHAQKSPVVLSRDELYRQVWATPIRTLAQQYDVSDRGLAKICARLNVPCPPRGYWARSARGAPDAPNIRRLSARPHR